MITAILVYLTMLICHFPSEILKQVVNANDTTVILFTLCVTSDIHLIARALKK